MTTEKITRAIKKELNGRINTLPVPEDYQLMFYEISKYLYQFSTSHADVINIQFDILKMLETGVQKRKDVLDVVGNNVIAFCDEFLGENQEYSWISKMKNAMNQNILKKLDKKR